MTMFGYNMVLPDVNGYTGIGGTITTFAGFTIHTFTSSGTFTPPIGVVVEYLVVAGGGGGGSSNGSGWPGGGGGAGGYLTATSFSVAADDFAQFSIAFPKSWNEGTITYQPFWTVTGTNTGNVVWQLGGIAVTSDATINTAFGTLIATTALAHSGTSNDLMVSAESGAVTIAGSPSTDDVCFFQINLDTSASAQSGVVRLVGIKVFFTTDAGNDA